MNAPESPDSSLTRVDGSRGEGGGQIIRSALTIAAVTGRPLEVFNVRSRRRSPGLKAQHLTAVKAIAGICDGQLKDAVIGSQRVQIVPGELRGGEYHFDVGTAGSTMLVLQTLLPALLLAKQPSVVELTGGTHNPLAPTFEFVDRAYLPMLRRMGADVSLQLHRRGFYPRGGGRVTVSIRPQKLRPLEVLHRGALVHREALAVCARLPEQIGDREVSAMCRALSWPASTGRVVVDTATDSPGNIAMLDLQFEGSAELVTEFGKVGLAAEKVAKRAARNAKKFLDAQAAVGEHLADQLMTPMALVAWRERGVSRMHAATLSSHASTLVELLPLLLGVRVEVEECDGNDEAVISLHPPN